MINLVTVKVTYENNYYENIDCEKTQYNIETNELKIITGSFTRTVKNVKKFEVRRFAS